jgi:hypothetical protein
MTLVACVFIWGSSWPCWFPNHMISVFFYNNGEGRVQAFLNPSLSMSQIMASGDTCSQGTSNARHVATLAGLKATRADYTTSSENQKTASGNVSVALTR